MMRAITLLFVFQIIVATSALGQVSFGEAKKINEGWKFQRGDVVDAKSPAFDDSSWRQVDLPHDWSIEAPLSPSLASSTGYLPGGIGWYRKTLNIPVEMKDKKIFIYFEGIYRNGEVFVNGNSVGMRPNGYISCLYEITPYLKFGAKNTISVRVDHSKYVDSRYYTGSGIYRDVYLISANPVHIGQWGVHYTTTSVKSNQANLRIRTTVVNTTSKQTRLTVVNELMDKEGQVMVRASKNIDVSAKNADTLDQEVKVSDPKLWSVNDPYLYKISTAVYEGKILLDKSIGNLGIRTLRFDPDKGFSLNDTGMKVKGVCLHHDAGCLGAAVPKEVWKRRLVTLKSLGCNAIRTSHNPQAPDFYDLCDELGFLVMDEPFDEWEFPKKKWVEGWNVGTPVFDGQSEYFKEWSDADLRDMVLRDRNHPSVFMWSLGNEVDYPNDPYSHPILDKEGIEQQYTHGYLPDHPNAERMGIIAKRLASVVKRYDTSRPVTGALAGPVMSNETEFPGVLDVVGYNYTEKRYAQDHVKYPKRVFYGSENLQTFDAWKSVKENDYIFGQFLWTGIEYLGEAHPWPSRGFGSGLLDLAGFKKSIAYFRESLWSDKPMIYIGTYPRNNWNDFFYDALPVWNFQQGDTVRVVCFTNCSAAQLNLNGQIAGETKKYDNETGVIYWDIPYQPGKLEATGYNSNQIVAQASIQTSKAPAVIKAVADTKVISSDKGVAQIEISIFDENGTPVYFSDNEITCKIDGPVRLLGLEAANPTDMSDYRDNKQRVYHGKMIAYIQATGKRGVSTIRFTSPWLKGDKVELTIE